MLSGPAPGQSLCVERTSDEGDVSLTVQASPWSVPVRVGHLRIKVMPLLLSNPAPGQLLVGHIDKVKVTRVVWTCPWSVPLRGPQQ